LDKIRHKITHTEIRYGILTLRKTDGSYQFFTRLPRTFTIIFKNSTLYERTASEKQVWMGIEVMRRLNAYDIVLIYKKGNIIHIESTH